MTDKATKVNGVLFEDWTLIRKSITRVLLFN